MVSGMGNDYRKTWRGMVLLFNQLLFPTYAIKKMEQTPKIDANEQLHAWLTGDSRLTCRLHFGISMWGDTWMDSAPPGSNHAFQGWHMQCHSLDLVYRGTSHFSSRLMYHHGLPKDSPLERGGLQASSPTSLVPLYDEGALIFQLRAPSLWYFTRLAHSSGFGSCREPLLTRLSSLHTLLYGTTFAT